MHRAGTPGADRATRTHTITDDPDAFPERQPRGRADACRRVAANGRYARANDDEPAPGMGLNDHGERRAHPAAPEIG